MKVPAYSRAPIGTPQRDWCCAQHVYALAEQIQKRWHEIGQRDVKITVIPLEGSHSSFAIRSNLVNGWPPARRHVSVAA